MPQKDQPQTFLEHNGFEAWVTLNSTGQKQPVLSVKRPQADNAAIKCWIEGVPDEVSSRPEAIATLPFGPSYA